MSSNGTVEPQQIWSSMFSNLIIVFNCLLKLYLYKIELPPFIIRRYQVDFMFLGQLDQKRDQVAGKIKKKLK